MAAYKKQRSVKKITRVTSEGKTSSVKLNCEVSRLLQHGTRARIERGLEREDH